VSFRRLFRGHDGHNGCCSNRQRGQIISHSIGSSLRGILSEELKALDHVQHKRKGREGRKGLLNV